MLFIAGNSSVTPCVCIVYIVCSLCTFFSLVSRCFHSYHIWSARWKVVLMVQKRHSKPLTLGASHAARLCGEDALLDGDPTPCSRCTCLYSVASSRGTHDGPGEQICMSDHVCTHHLPRLRGASHIDAFCMVRPFSQELQLWLLHTLDTPPSFVCLPCFIFFNLRVFFKE